MVPSEPVSRPARSYPGRSGSLPPVVDARCRRAARTQAEHVIGRDAVGQRVRPAGVFGHVAADGAGALAGGVGRVEVLLLLHRQRDIEIHHARLAPPCARSPGRSPGSVHAREGDRSAASTRNGAAAQSGAGAAAHEGHSRARALISRSPTTSSVDSREDHHLRPRLIDTAVVLVERQILRLVEVAAGADDLDQLALDRRGQSHTFEGRHNIDPMCCSICGESRAAPRCTSRPLCRCGRSCTLGILEGPVRQIDGLLRIARGQNASGLRSQKLLVDLVVLVHTHPEDHQTLRAAAPWPCRSATESPRCRAGTTSPRSSAPAACRRNSRP